jgi:hypothetical protein
MGKLMRAALVLGVVGCVLLAASYWLPGMRPGDVVGANIGAGALFGLGVLASAAGVSLGLFGVATQVGERSRFALAALGIAVTTLALFLVGSATYA